MNDKIIKSRRAAFENAFPDERFVWNSDECGYWPANGSALGDGVLGQCLTRDKHLIVWNAALDSLCVDLPFKVSDDNDYDDGYVKAIEECRSAIHAAGVRTK